MSLIRRKFAPVMPMQQLVHRRQRHRAPLCSFELRLDLANHQNAAITRRVQERLEQFGFSLVTEILSASPSTYGLAFVANKVAGDELVSQTTRPSPGDSNGLGRLFQTQTVSKQKENGLNLSQLLYRRRGGQALKRTINSLLTSGGDAPLITSSVCSIRLLLRYCCRNGIRCASGVPVRALNVLRQEWQR